MTRPVPTDDARAQALLDEIGELYAILLRISRRVEHDEPMTATQRLALIEIAVVGPMRLLELAARMDTTAATASRAVDVLEELPLRHAPSRPGRRPRDPDRRHGEEAGAGRSAAAASSTTCSPTCRPTSPPCASRRRSHA